MVFHSFTFARYLNWKPVYNLQNWSILISFAMNILSRACHLCIVREIGTSIEIIVYFQSATVRGTNCVPSVVPVSVTITMLGRNVSSVIRISVSNVITSQKYATL